MIRDPALTSYLERWAEDGREGLDEVFPLVYDELRSLARAHLGRGEGITLQPTVLVNEAYLRLADHRASPFASRSEFFAFASKVIRHVLVDHVRRRSREKRGGAARDLPIELAAERTTEAGLDAEGMLGLHRALGRLESSHPEQARVVELRFFGGLTHPEIAEVSGLSLATVERHWGVGRRRLAYLLSH